MNNLPYVTSPGTLKKMLNQIKTAAVPSVFSQSFVSDTLRMKGGTPRATIPFIKKMGLVDDAGGAPTDRYKMLRNEKKSGRAIAEAMRELYRPLFDMDENVDKASDSELKGLIVEATGGQKDSQVTKLTLSTFKTLREMADFDHGKVDNDPGQQSEVDVVKSDNPAPDSYGQQSGSESINLSYTINLNLPQTSDIEVFNAIFKSLKEHLLPK